MAFTLPALPYPDNALEPHISQETLTYHYGKHHAGYVNKLNAAVDGTNQAKQVCSLVKPPAHHCPPFTACTESLHKLKTGC